ncbi:MAG: hypothetical protein E6Q97_25005 [Desulfurellales bacterium]|nr:MAG: hypothetical protein E6Q97_25005 [Desulfurellales bacterium]
MDIDYDKYPEIRVFESHGVEFTGQRGDEFYGNCPFSGKAGKFYVNRKTWLWDSKSAGMSGNLQTFLSEMSNEYHEDIDVDELAALAADRHLPEEAFKGWSVGWTGSRYTIPVLDYNDKIQDIRMYNLKKHRMLGTAGCKVGLIGAHLLKKRKSEVVYLCEGEWDAIALNWLLRKLKQDGAVVGVPGAGTFKREWAEWLRGRAVITLYDHDDPGIEGEHRAVKMLSGVVKSFEHIHWPESLPSGFDVRDWIVYGIKKKTLDLCLQRLWSLRKASVRSTGAQVQVAKTESGKKIILIGNAEKAPRSRPAKVPTLQDVHACYRKWLHLPSTDAIDVMLATALSETMDGPPVWMFLVAPPGGAKTITLAGLTEYERTYSTSSLTAHSLISGHGKPNMPDPSLIPRLDGKILVIKDFTSILGMRDNEKEEIFGILRDAYDGKCGKVFGTGLERNYKSRFTIVAAVTPSIYEIGSRHAALGERFLKYVMGDNLNHHQEEEIISMAIENVDRDSQIKDEIAGITADFLQFGFGSPELPELSNDLHRRIIALAQLGARLRGTVSRDAFHEGMMTGRPFAEVGSRLGIQLAKIARALAMVRKKKQVTREEYLVVRKILLDTVSQRTEDIVRALHDAGGQLTAEELSTKTHYPMTTVRRLLEDMSLLKIVYRQGSIGSGFKHKWVLTDYIRKAIQTSGVYAPEMPRLTIRIRVVP